MKIYEIQVTTTGAIKKGYLYAKENGYTHFIAHGGNGDYGWNEEKDAHCPITEPQELSETIEDAVEEKTEPELYDLVMDRFSQYEEELARLTGELADEKAKCLQLKKDNEFLVTRNQELALRNGILEGQFEKLQKLL